MGYMKLIVFVEGFYDRYFFSEIIQPSLQSKYNHIQIIEYANDDLIKVDNYLKTLNQMRSLGFDYIFIADMDNCCEYKQKKQKLKNKFKNVDVESIFLVMKEIEGWYLSGLDEKNKQKLRFKPRQDCNNILKESFESSIPNGKTKNDFLSEVIKVFKISVAKKQSPSFEYLCQNLGL
ncbi:hypothetical protein [Bacillus pumilus]|uniref:hypothetical protein n=1 Tax=Bacillus pumilus TaxID=1408 RepID=UPI00203CA637|nr:hypothetical protein [Bacillus pumilus]MCM3150278.1 hypothetical protein [Bacillus pumilus]